jgi:hypothetical protein
MENDAPLNVASSAYQKQAMPISRENCWFGSPMSKIPTSTNGNRLGLSVSNVITDLAQVSERDCKEDFN